MPEQIPFPPARRIGGRVYFVRDEVERYKAALAGLPTPPSRGVIELVPTHKLADELGISPKTLERRREIVKVSA